MDSLEILNRNIKNEIEDREILKVSFTNYEDEFVDLWHSGHINAPFCNTKRLPKNLYDEIIGMITGTDFDEIFGDVTTIDSKMEYDQFFNRYYNDLDPISDEKKEELNR